MESEITMLTNIPFRNGRLDFSNGPAHNSRTIVISNHIAQQAGNGSINAILPASYPCPQARRVVPLTSLVLDFGQRLRDYDPARLSSIVRALMQGVALPPLSVEARDNGTYIVRNGYHRFLACAMMGFQSITIDQPGTEAVAQPVKKAAYIPPGKRAAMREQMNGAK